MSFCRRCGTRLENDMAYCPKCGTPVAFQQPSPPVRHETKSTYSLAIAGIIALAAAAIIVIALIIGGFLPTDLNRIIGSGNTQTQQFQLSDFTEIEAGNGFNVVITQADTYSVSITADDNIFESISVNKTDNTLVIRLTPNLSFTTSVLRAEISMPDLQAIDFSGGVVASASGFDLAHDFSVQLSGGSRFTMTGQATNLTATCSGDSNLNLSEFEVNNAEIDLSGGSQATINLDGRLDADASGGSRLFYRGTPTIGNINTSGGASVTKAD